MDFILPAGEAVCRGEVADGGMQALGIVVVDEVAGDALGAFKGQWGFGGDGLLFERFVEAFGFSVGRGVVGTGHDVAGLPLGAKGFELPAFELGPLAADDAGPRIAGNLLRMRGLGLPGDGGERGDILATVSIVTPAIITPEEKILWGQLALGSSLEPGTEVCRRYLQGKRIHLVDGPAWKAIPGDILLPDSGGETHAGVRSCRGRKSFGKYRIPRVRGEKPWRQVNRQLVQCGRYLVCNHLQERAGVLTQHHLALALARVAQHHPEQTRAPSFAARPGHVARSGRSAR